VFGWHPNWAPSGAYLSYDYTALTDIGYFSYETDTATGSYTTTNGWTTTPMIYTAHRAGVKMILVVTNFGGDENDAVLGSPAKQAVMIDTLIALLQQRGGDGLNFDFEEVNGSQRANLVSFMQQVSSQVKSRLPAAEISMATPAIDADSAFDLAQLSQVCDYLIMMGYDYYWSGSAKAGPVAPLVGEDEDVTISIDAYLAAGVAPAKLLLGVPWYGYDWPVSSSRREAITTGAATAFFCDQLDTEAITDGRIFDSTTETPWFSYEAGTQWHETWYEDSTSLALKYQFANSKNLGGIGIWALSYQPDGSQFWEGIKSAFSTSGATGVPIAKQNTLPAVFALRQNYPNPFNPTTTIRFTLASQGLATLSIFNVLGEEVASLLGSSVMEPGEHQITWNANDLKGNEVPSGVYFYRLNVQTLDGSAPITTAKKMLLMR
jgi:spore germination protein YaaH